MTSLYHLPDEILYEVFSYLDNPITLGRCLRVNKQWKKVANNEGLWKKLYPEEAFNKMKWAKYFGEIGEEPPLPRKIYSILNAPCPFWPGKKIRDTHILGIVPKTVDLEELTLNKWKVLISSPKSGNATKFDEIADSVATKNAHESPSTSYWVLMLKDILPKSNNKSIPEQKALIAKLISSTKYDYKVPLMLDVIACIFMEYVSTKKRLFSDDPYMLIRCQEDLEMAIGGFATCGLNIYKGNAIRSSIGAVVMQKF